MQLREDNCVSFVFQENVGKPLRGLRMCGKTVLKLGFRSEGVRGNSAVWVGSVTARVETFVTAAVNFRAA